ncbi:MAG: hypothetical protein NTZ25_03590 [Candidatus Peregrinibacteria bacterium]|nr:hypothetical protein [Candidatus Peregrinibacteria bacterium]
MEDLEKQMWKKVEKYVRYLNFVPFLRMVAVCNNLAFSNLNDKSDIDLFIVAKKGRLFMVRTFVTAILHLLGVRRHRNKVAGRFCLSFFVDDSCLNLSPIAIEDDVYLRVWIKTLLPVIDDGVSKDFADANSWVNDDFEVSSGGMNKPVFFFKKSKMKILFQWLLSGKLGNLMENKLLGWQLKRARQKASSLSDPANLVISEHILKFHNFDRRREYRGLWRSKFGNSKITLEKFKELSINKN